MIGIIGLFTQLEIDEIQKIDYQIMDAETISFLALDFNVENFHTQLEAWEYAYEPSEKRLNAFNTHRDTLHNLLNQLSDATLEAHNSKQSSNDISGLYENGFVDINKIHSNMLLVDNNWNELISEIRIYAAAIESGASDEKISRLEQSSRNKVTSNEDLFDGLMFNKEIDNFVNLQQVHTESLQVLKRQISDNIVRNILILTIIFITIGVILIYLISRLITIPLKKLESASTLLSKGHYDVDYVDSNIDEISNLSKSFFNMKDELLSSIQRESDLTLEKIKSERLVSIGELSARIAHDIRNPLNIIKISLENVKLLTNDSTRLDKTIDRCDRAVNRITHQIDGIMDFLKDSELTISTLSIKKLFEQIISELTLTKEIKIILPQNDVSVQCDEIKINSLFYNLLINAIQAMEFSGVITIFISEKSDNVVQIDVENDGPSILQESIDKIFEPLFTTKQVGTGLGLASCKKIIEQHHGTISVKNNPTTFTIIIPIKYQQSESSD